MKWIKPSDKLPPQGKKVLYEKAGDIYVVQRLAEMWLPIPFVDSKYASWEAPDVWADFKPNGSLTGKMHVFVDDIKYDIDEFEEKYPFQYAEFIDAIRKLWKKDER